MRQRCDAESTRGKARKLARATIGTKNCTTASAPRLQNHTNTNEIERNFWGGGGGTIFGSDTKLHELHW
eukprot:4028719-Amphidinium_carterae.1